ncbi:HEAT repeat domain-containing protein [Pigmentibacter sp. JX0631]|uniref:HEAT repeat domain-containing protein n=1 Tax=Pigmentibacter sp. JX0631 TaxID=2976982 RepID=UPI0024696C18|nr:HEAT repeat domain-containing protein [Pigmentibacter sp. JX0631]WGL58648.1 HEAT repeat domain-containing protein [Pigmentibacter sp. JX0631]
MECNKIEDILQKFDTDCFFSNKNKELVIEIINQEAIKKFLISMLNKIIKNPFYSSENHKDNVLTLYADEKIIVTLKLMKKNNYSNEILKDKEILDSPMDLLIYSFGKGKTKFKKFSKNIQHNNNDLFEKDIKLNFDSFLEIEPENFIEVRQGIDLIKLIEISDDVFHIFVCSKKSFDYLTSYDSISLESKDIFCINQNSSRISIYLDLLANLGDSACIETIEKFKNHKNHFIRWEVVKSILQIDTEKGIDLLNEAVNDRHIHVKNAALNTISNLKNNSII